MISLKQLIMCESVRTETHNKLSLMGVYGRDVIFKNDKQWQEKKILALPSLAFYCQVEGLTAPKVEGQWRLLDPDGEDTVQPREISVNDERDPDATTVFIFQITPCIFKKIGSHRLSVDLGDLHFEHPFGVRVVDELPSWS